MTIQVYCDPCTVNSRKVLAGLQEINADYNQNFIDYFAGGQKSEEFTKINPHQTVPAATDGDLTLTESNAILQYAADVSGSDSMYPKDLKQRADVNRWLLWEASVWFPCCYVYLVENVVKPLLKGSPDQATLDKEDVNFHKNANILETRLKKTGAWIAGPNVTIADFAVAAPMHVYAAQKLPLENYPELRRWMKQMEGLESWQKTQEAVDKALGLSSAAANGATNGANGANGHPAEIRTTVNYTKDVAPELTELYFYETPKADKSHAPGDAPVEISIADGWPKAKEITLDKNGFALHDFKTSFNSWETDETVRSAFYPEIVDFMKKSLGAKKVLVFDHTTRSEKNAKKALTDEKNTSQRSPVMLVHCDYTAESGPIRVEQLMGDEAKDLLSRRVAFINVWKPINRIVEERPLAMCDVESCSDEDFFKLHLRYRDRDGENYVMKHSPRHKWYYFPKMSPDNVILLKTYDSETDGRARFVGHSAFVDPTSPKDAPLRESVEIRTICFF